MRNDKMDDISHSVKKKDLLIFRGPRLLRSISITFGMCGHEEYSVYQVLRSIAVRFDQDWFLCLSSKDGCAALLHLELTLQLVSAR